MPPPDGIQQRARALAVTAVMVGLGLYVAVRLISSVATVLIGAAVISAVGYAILLVVRRQRW